jgi:hypothetical protein
MERDPKHLADQSERMIPRELSTEEFGLHGRFRSGSWVMRLTFLKAVKHQSIIQQHNDRFRRKTVDFL